MSEAARRRGLMGAEKQEIDPAIYNWDFTKSLTDSVGGLTFELANSNGGTSLPTQDATGLHFTGATQIAKTAYRMNIFDGRRYELDIAEANYVGGTGHRRLLCFSGGLDAIVFRSGGTPQVYYNAWRAFTAVSGQSIPSNSNTLSGKTLGIKFGSDKTLYLYVDRVLVGTIPSWMTRGDAATAIYIGGRSTGSASDGNQIQNMTITGLRIYAE